MTMAVPQGLPETFDEGKKLLPPQGIKSEPPVLQTVACSLYRMVLNISSLRIGSSFDA